jgi:hypothetical protein
MKRERGILIETSEGKGGLGRKGVSVYVSMYLCIEHCRLGIGPENIQWKRYYM